MPDKKIIVSGAKPSGKLHLGNYLGALKNFVDLQDKYHCFFFIADLHSLTSSFSAKEKERQIIEFAADFLALGIDPKKSVLFIQSHVPEHSELTWIFNCLTPFAELKRMTQFKDMSEHDPSNINVGLFDYPVLQAADILIYKPAFVPVGKDQLQHLELTRTIARTFNKRFGRTFPEPEPIITETQNIMSLANPMKKMSKSHGLKNYLALTDEPDVIKEKLSKAVTDTGKDKNAAMSPGVKNLFLLLKQFGTDETYKYFTEAHSKGNIKYNELKIKLAEDISSHFADFRAQRKKLLKDPERIKSIFKDGAEKARVTARKTLIEVREKIGLV